MKKTILAVVLVLVALGALTTGVAYAQGIGGGFLHDYIVKAYADALGLTADALNARLAGGEILHQIAVSQGVAANQIPTLLTAAHTKALDAAVADGVITADQAVWMKSHSSGSGMMNSLGVGGMMRNGLGFGNMMSGFGSGMMRNGSGFGGMMGGWQRP